MSSSALLLATSWERCKSTLTMGYLLPASLQHRPGELPLVKLNACSPCTCSARKQANVLYRRRKSKTVPRSNVKVTLGTGLKEKKKPLEIQREREELKNQLSNNHCACTYFLCIWFSADWDQTATSTPAAVLGPAGHCLSIALLSHSCTI